MPEGVAVEPEVIVRADGATLWLQLNRPEALNSISLDAIDLLQEGLDQAARDSSVAAVALTGTGRAFCAGADLKTVGAGGKAGELRRRLGPLLSRIESFDKPVLAAVNGLALAGGLELLLACDLVFAAESARIGDGHSNYGLLPGGGATVRLPRVVGRTRALEMFYSGELYDAATLERWGLVNRVVPGDDLIAAVNQWGARLAAKSPLGIARMKHLVRDTGDQPTATGLSLELSVSALHEKSHDMTEGVNAFVEKRRPAFTGS